VIDTTYDGGVPGISELGYILGVISPFHFRISTQEPDRDYKRNDISTTILLPVHLFFDGHARFRRLFPK
jgi:hypothetical protein